MATVIAVRFKRAGKVYYFDPATFWPKPGDNVIVETTQGMEFGTVLTGVREVDDAQITQPLKKVLRMATEQDEARAAQNDAREKEARKLCQERIHKHKLDMKLVDAEYAFDSSKIIFYFTADGRVDFRDLVKDLASVFKMRIELRQIGVRDEAKMLGGLGICGRPLCCGTFMCDFQPLSIRMAKDQNLSLNPTKISGQCGRLMCCLKYEQDNYEQVLKSLPKVGKDIVTPDGLGVIQEINVIRETVRVRIRLEDESFDLREYPIADVRRPNADDGVAARETPKASKPAQQENTSEEDAKKKRYPHPKQPKNLSTDQYFENLEQPTEEKPPVKENKRKHKPKPENENDAPTQEA